jgi:hypothetical protein
MKTDDVANDRETPGAWIYGLYLLALGVCLIGNLFVRIGAEAGWLPSAGRAAVAVLTALPLVAAAVMFRRLLRSELDEMVQRIVLEGLAFAFVVYVPVAALYVNLRAAGVWVPRLDPPDILFTPALLAAIGIMLAWRRLK